MDTEDPVVVLEMGAPPMGAKRMRQVHSVPSMASSPPPPGSKSLGSLPTSNNAQLFSSGLKDLSGPSLGSRASNATLSSYSSGTKPKVSPDERSPVTAANNVVDETEDIEEDHDGAHDTITSLAGARMLQRYRRAISGSHKGSSSSLNQQNRLEDLFLIEEDAKDDEFVESESPPLIQTNSFPLTAEIFIPPDGGYGWLIAFGAFNALFWTAGMVKSYGVIFALILKTFPESSVALASWIPASMTTLALAVSPCTSALCQKYNCRTVTFIGSMLCFIGITSSSFAGSVEMLFLTFGLCTGLGIGLSTTPGIILVARYFDKRRGLANAFCLSGTAAGSLCLPFLIEALASTYSFSGTLLILGACMLHISISAALYRPLATHVRIMSKHQKSTVVQLQEATAEAIKDQQYLLNKEPLEHQHHLKKLQSHQSSHHHHSNGVDPEAIMARLQGRLDSIDGNITDREDSISVNSSVSQVAHHHAHSGSHTPHHYQQHHHHHHHLGYRNSFTSLPPNLDQHHNHNSHEIQTPLNSSFSSREDLQCNWHELPKFDIHQSSDLAELELASRPSTTETAKPMTLSTLFLHQFGSRLSQYKSLLLQDRRRKKGMTSNLASYISVGDAQQPPSISRKESFGKTLDPDPSNDQPKEDTLASSLVRKLSSRRSTFIFSIEDMTTDSTSILKDTRHPSLSSVELGQSLQPGQTLGRVVSFSRMHKASMIEPATRKISAATATKRKRCHSEGHHPEMHPLGSRFFIYSSNDQSSKLGASLVSLDYGLAGAPTPILELDEDDEVTKEKAKKASPLMKCWMFLNKYLDLSLVKEPLFLMMVSSVMAMAVGVPHVLFFIPSYTRNIGATVDPAVLLCATSVADLIGRLAFGVLLDANFASKHLIYALMILATGLSVIGLTLTRDAIGLSIAMLIYGLGSGGWFLMVPLLLADYLTVERIGSSYGLVRLFQAMSNLIGPVLGGVLSDYTGSFAASFIAMGSIMCLGAVPALFKPMLSRRMDSKSGCA